MPVDFEAIRDSWVQGVNQLRTVDSVEKMVALPIHSLVAKLYRLMRVQGEAEKLDDGDVRVFKSISERKIKYYRNHKFKILGYIKEIFSRFRNLLLVGRFQSSGQLGKDLTTELLARPSTPQRDDAPPAEPEDDSESGEIDATGDGTPRREKKNKSESSSRSSSPDLPEEPMGDQQPRTTSKHFPKMEFPDLKPEWANSQSEGEDGSLSEEGFEVERDGDITEPQDVPPRTFSPTTLRV